MDQFPSEQLSELRDQVPFIQGEHIGNTFKENAISNLLQNFERRSVKITSSHPERCRAKKVSFKSKNKTGLSVNQKLENVFSDLEQNKALPLEFSETAEPNHYELIIDRCCIDPVNNGNSNAPCKSIDRSKIELHFR